MARSGDTPTDFAGRLALAIQLADKSPTRVGRETGLRAGIFKLLGVAKSKPTTSPGPEVVQRLADYLQVAYEWLAIGRGPMRNDPHFAATPLESAKRFAQSDGLRPDAIAAAVARYRSREPVLSRVDWLHAFELEARCLEREGVPRPEEVEAAQRRARDLSKRARALKSELAELGTAGDDAPGPAPRPPRALKPKR